MLHACRCLPLPPPLPFPTKHALKSAPHSDGRHHTLIAGSPLAPQLLVCSENMDARRGTIVCVQNMIASAGKTILVSGTTLTLCFVGLCFFELVLLRTYVGSLCAAPCAHSPVFSPSPPPSPSRTYEQ